MQEHRAAALVFPIRSWVDLRWMRDCQNCFCLLLNLSTLGSLSNTPHSGEESLYLSDEFAPRYQGCPARARGGGRTIEQIEQKCCRACLQNVSVEGARANGPFRENIGQFDAARQLFSHPLPFLTGTRKRGQFADYISGSIFGLCELGIAAKLRSFLSVGPQASPQRREVYTRD